MPPYGFTLKHGETCCVTGRELASEDFEPVPLQSVPPLQLYNPYDMLVVRS